MTVNGESAPTLRPTLNLQCTGATAVDDPENDQTTLNIPSGGGGSVDFDAVATALAAADDAIDVNGEKITGLGTPTNGTDAATKGYVDSTASAAADDAIAAMLPLDVTDIAPSVTNGDVLTTTAGVVGWAAPAGGAPSFSDVNSALATANATVSINGQDLHAGDVLAAGYFYTGATVAGAGNIRLGNTHSIRARNAANSADVCLAQYSAGDAAYFGLDSGFGSQAFSTIIGASYSIYLAVASNYYIHLEASEVRFGYPIVGDATVYGVHGQVTSAHTDADYTVPSGEYKYRTIKFGTACTAGRTITFPAPASDAAAYEKEVVNTSGQTLTFNTGSGGKTLANGLAVRLRFTASEGTKYASATYTP